MAYYYNRFSSIQINLFIIIFGTFPLGDTFATSVPRISRFTVAGIWTFRQSYIAGHIVALRLTWLTTTNEFLIHGARNWSGGNDFRRNWIDIKLKWNTYASRHCSMDTVLVPVWLAALLSHCSLAVATPCTTGGMKIQLISL